VAAAPIDVATQATIAFIAQHVPAGGSLLEVGCGSGHVAQQLLATGYRVTAIDSDAQAVAQARNRGVDARVVSWPNFAREAFDAVLFTRSLHHIGPLDAAIRKACELVKPGGMLLVEDFAFEDAGAATIAWLLGILRSPRVRARLVAAPDALASELLAASDPISAWRHSHDHDLHTQASMRHAIERAFVPGAEVRTPYLYRYLIPVLPETPEAANVIEAVLEEEASRGIRGEIGLIGWRMVAQVDPAIDLSA